MAAAGLFQRKELFAGGGEDAGFMGGETAALGEVKEEGL
jgi:hypothetical protein